MRLGNHVVTIGSSSTYVQLKVKLCDLAGGFCSFSRGLGKRFPWRGFIGNQRESKRKIRPFDREPEGIKRKCKRTIYVAFIEITVLALIEAGAHFVKIG